MDKARLERMHSTHLAKNMGDYVVHQDPVFEDKFIAIVHKDANDVPTLAVATCFLVEKDDGTSKHNVIAAFDGKDLYLSCDDNGVNGTRAGQEAVIQSTLATAMVETGLTTAQSEVLYKELTEMNGATDKDTGCNFWAKYTETAGEEGCKHVGAVLEDQGVAIWERMEGAFNARMGALLAKEQGLTVADVEVQLAKDIKDLAFGTPILIEGERGTGKTFEAKMFAKKNDFKLVVAGGHEGIESADLLGHYVQGRDDKGQSTMLWKDGPISESFRAASEGKETVLVIDELLRIPQRQLNVLLTALSADEHDVFELRTGRMTADNTEEVLRAPQSKLAIIGTTNVGMEYAVDEIDPALMDRFTTVYKETSLDDVRKILGSAAKQLGLPDADADKAVKFYSMTKNLETRGAIKSAPSVRSLCMAMKLAPRKGLEWALGTQTGKMVSRGSNGAPLADEVKVVQDTIAKAFAPEKEKVKAVNKGR